AAAAVHLEICRECQALASDLRSVSREVGAWEVPASDSQISPRILIALDEHIRKQESVPKRQSRSLREKLRFRRVVGWSLAGVGLILLMVAIAVPNLMRDKEAAERSADATRVEHQTMTVEIRPSNSLGGLTAAPGTARRQPLNGYVSSGDEVKKPVSRELAIPTGPMVIRTAELTLIAGDFEQSRNKLEEILKHHNGYLGQLTVSGSADSARTLTATLRVPADKLDAAI